MRHGSLNCESYWGSLMGISYLYLWYKHTSFVSNAWVGSSRLCGQFSTK